MLRDIFEALAKDIGIEVPQVCLELDKYLPALKPHEFRQVEECIMFLEMTVRDVLVKVATSRARSIVDVVRAAVIFGRRIGEAHASAKTMHMWTKDIIMSIIGAIRYVLLEVIGRDALEKALKPAKT